MAHQSSPPPAVLSPPQSPPQPTFAPSPTLANGSSSRAPLPQPRGKRGSPPDVSKAFTPKRNSQIAPLGHPLTQAEEYAHAHSTKKERASEKRDKVDKDKENVIGKKPLLEWISRKFAGRKGSFPEGGGAAHGHGPIATAHSPSASPSTSNAGSTPMRGRMTSLPGLNPPPVLTGTPHHATIQNRISPSDVFPPSTLSREDSGFIRRSESHSLRFYPGSITDSERVRVREANNPYPSIPVPLVQRESTIDSQSISFLTRSRTPSLRSNSSTRPRVSLGDSSFRWSAVGGADEDASIRPFPPSAPSSPAPSTSVISRSASASLLSPVQTPGAFGPPSSRRAPSPPSHLLENNPQSGSSSAISSDADRNGRRSRRDSASTKPTTVLSFDSGPHAARIAQAPDDGASAGHSITSSPLRQSIDTTMLAGPSSPNHSPSLPGIITPTSAMSPGSLTPVETPPATLAYFQAPKHSQPHPRDNPHPSSPPEPNASTLTLASSTFAIPPPLSPNVPLTDTSGIPPFRVRHTSTSSVPSSHHGHPLSVNIQGSLTPSQMVPNNRGSSLSTSPSVTFAPDLSTMGDIAERPLSMTDSVMGAPSFQAPSIYGHAPSSMRIGDWHNARGVADGDASVRAVRRKGSWESNESRWSWRGARGQAAREQSGGVQQGGAQAQLMPPHVVHVTPALASPSSRSTLSTLMYGADGEGSGAGQSLGIPLTSVLSNHSNLSGSDSVDPPVAPEGSARDSIMTRNSFKTAPSLVSLRSDRNLTIDDEMDDQQIRPEAIRTDMTDVSVSA